VLAARAIPITTVPIAKPTAGAPIRTNCPAVSSPSATSPNPNIATSTIQLNTGPGPLMSVMQTCRQRRVNILSYLAAAQRSPTMVPSGSG
jgi:hypothetical protein